MADEAFSTYILAGGKSSRMCGDKAFLELAGRRLIDRALKIARQVSPGHVFLLGPRAKFAAYGRCVQDRFTGAGPLGGIHAALAETETDLNLVFPVDMPFLEAQPLRELAARACASKALVTVSRSTDGCIQPVVAVFRREFLPVAETALREGRFKLDALYDPNWTLVLESENVGFTREMFDNLNTPEEFALASERMGKTSRADGKP